jgi:Zn-dependent protease
MAKTHWLFSREAKEIIISMVALSLVFSYPDILSNPMFFFVSLLVLGVGFIGHEMMHRQVARKYGFWAEYRMWPQGLLLALLFAIASNGSIMFAAPGAVMFASLNPLRKPNKKEIGKIGIAGTVFNLVVMSLFIIMNLMLPNRIFTYGAMVNGWLAFFNLIPFGPLDGRKVMVWSRVIWLVAIAGAVAGMALVIFAF